MNSPATPAKLALVIPTLNEAGNMAELITRLHEALKSVDVPYELLVVDDESQDGTAEVVQRFVEEDPRVRLFIRKGQRGLSGAVIHGWKHSDGTLLGVIDADLQHPPEVLPKLVDAILQGNDIAVASRYVAAHGADDWSRVRKFISRAGTWITMPLQRSYLPVKDPLSGFFIVRRECITDIDLQPKGFKILLEILVKGRIQSAVEVPFRFATRHYGKSKADVTVAVQYFSLLGKLSRRAIFGHEPQ